MTDYSSKQRSLNFRYLKDPELDLGARIVYSYLWKWAHINFLATTKPAKYKAKPVTHKRIIRATGFNLKTVRSTLQTLKKRGYLDKRLEPFQGHPAIMWSTGRKKIALNRPLKWTGNKDIKRTIARLFIQTHPKKVSANYFVKVLGISRATCFRLMKKQGVTVETVGVMDETIRGRPLRLPGVTVETVGVTVETLSNSNAINTESSNSIKKYPNTNTTVRDADMTGRFSKENQNHNSNVDTAAVSVTADDAVSLAISELLAGIAVKYVEDDLENMITDDLSVAVA